MVVIANEVSNLPLANEAMVLIANEVSNLPPANEVSNLIFLYFLISTFWVIVDSFPLTVRK
jgi:hypothetical protein